MARFRRKFFKRSNRFSKKRKWKAFKRKVRAIAKTSGEIKYKDQLRDPQDLNGQGNAIIYNCFPLIEQGDTNFQRTGAKVNIMKSSLKCRFYTYPGVNSQNMCGWFLRIDLVMFRTAAGISVPTDAQIPQNIMINYDPTYFKVLKTKTFTFNSQFGFIVGPQQDAQPAPNQIVFKKMRLRFKNGGKSVYYDANNQQTQPQLYWIIRLNVSDLRDSIPMRVQSLTSCFYTDS